MTANVPTPSSCVFHATHSPTSLLIPAMVAAVTVCPGDEIVAIHRIFLKADGTEIPIEVTREVVERGRNRFQIYCTPCHGESGYDC